MSFFSFQPPDPETLARIQEAHSRVEMSVESFRHSVVGLMDSLSKDDLLTLQRMLHTVMHDEQLQRPEGVAATWDGMIRGHLQFKHNVCPSCMVNHEEALFGPDDRVPPVTDKQADNIITDFVKRADEAIVDGMRARMDAFTEGRSHMDPMPDQDDEEDGVRTSDFTALEREQADRYHVDDVRIEGTNELVGVICTGINGMKDGCGLRWPSLEDRMLREPEDCGGCHIKSAHG